MTPEELKAQLDALKAEMSTAVGALKATNEAQAAELARVKKHAGRLLVDLKKAKVKVRTNVEDDNDEDDNEDEVPGDDAATARIAAMEKQLAAERAKNAERATKQAIDEALDANKVAPGFRKAVAALIRASGKIEVADDAVTVGGKALSEHVAEWAKSDEGKPYVSAPASGTSNAPTSGRNRPAAPTIAEMAGKSKKDFTVAQKGAFIRTNGEDAWGKLPA